MACDVTTRFAFPFPNFVDESIATVVVFGLFFFSSNFTLYDHLGCDARVVVKAVQGISRLDDSAVVVSDEDQIRLEAARRLLRPPQSVTLDIEGSAIVASGSASHAWIERAKLLASVVPGVERITLNLAARFAADALEESYFGWDPGKGGRGEHNLLRARGQAALLRSIHGRRAELEAALGRARA